jgi:sulfofructose kinase
MIICLGHAALDRIYRIDAFPPTPRKVLARGFEEVGGGMAANAAVAAARLGARVAFCGRIGDDLAGQAIRAELLGEGVDVTNLRSFAEARSSTSAVIVDAAGERLLVNERGGGLPDDPSWLDLSAVARARVVMADMRWPRGALALFQAARGAGVMTVLDIDVDAGPTLPDLLRLSDFALFSAPGLAEFSAAEAPDALAAIRRLGPRHAGVTRGAGGYLWLDDEGPHDQPAFAVEAVDTSGAGDAFHGGFIWALAEGLETAACVRVGQATAALKSLTPGNRKGLPRLAALQAFLARS